MVGEKHALVFTFVDFSPGGLLFKGLSFLRLANRRRGLEGSVRFRVSAAHRRCLLAIQRASNSRVQGR